MIETGLCWALFGLLHSVLAGAKTKVFVYRWLTPRHYRLLYNCIALITAMPAILLVQKENAPALYLLPTIVSTAMVILGGLLLTLSQYDFLAFLGIREEHTDFTVAGVHRFIRHPWYLAALLLLWSAPMTPRMLTTQCILSLYIWLGIYFEEQKLVRLLGERYRHYQKAVPKLLPCPARFLSVADARALTDR